VRIISRENIFNNELQVMDINIRDKRPKNAESAPFGEPKGRRSGTRTPRMPFFKDIFSFDDRGPNRRDTRTCICLKNFMTVYIFVREEINPQFVR